MLIALFLSTTTYARPLETVGFSETDDVQTLDSDDGRIRVHYSVEGPSQTRLTDTDQNGLPDFVERVLETSAAALDRYEGLGFAPLPTESSFGLELGGSGATDIYLVPIPGLADGSFRTDACNATSCAGYLLVDHRFDAWGTSWGRGLDIVVVHELFHGVQFAYAPGWSDWMSEGGATWATNLFDIDEGSDLRFFADGYLEQADRPIDRPPGGAAGLFTYGTGLFFDFLARRTDPSLVVELYERSASLVQEDVSADLLPTIDALLVERGDSLANAFQSFTVANLATGERAGAIESHPRAERYTAPPAAWSGVSIQEDLRVFPYGMQFVSIDHPGGPFHMGFGEPTTLPVQLTLHPTEASVVLPSVWDGPNTSSVPLDLDAGTYWLSATVVEPGTSQLMSLCIGDPTALSCIPEDEDPPGCSHRSSMWFGMVALPLVLRRRRTC